MISSIFCMLLGFAFKAQAHLAQEEAVTRLSTVDLEAEIIVREGEQSNAALDSSGWDGVVEKIPGAVQVAYAGDNSEFSMPSSVRAHGSACDSSGVASWYGPGFNGRRTASGETYNENAMTAAHKSLSFGTHVRVTNRQTGRSIVVRITDRGPYVRGRIIDLSAAAKRALGMGGGTAPVQITCT